MHTEKFDNFHNQFWKNNNESYRRAKLASGDNKELLYTTFIRDNEVNFKKYFLESLRFTAVDIKESFLSQIAEIKEKLINIF